MCKISVRIASLLAIIILPLITTTIAHASPSWLIETRDTGAGNVGEYSSIAVDSNGYPHIAYYDDAFNNLNYTYRDASGWHTATVEPKLGVIGYDKGQFVSLALDGSDNPHISYYDATYPRLRYAYNDGSGWNTGNVDSTEDVGKHSSIAIDSSGHPHISYYDATNHDLKYAYNDGSGWATETVDSAGDVGWYTSIAVDSIGQPHVSYYDNTNSRLKYTYKDGSGWHSTTITTGLAYTNAGWLTSIALDDSDNPHISHVAGPAGGDYLLMHTYHNGSAWQTEVPVDSAQAIYSTSIALDNTVNNYPRIGYLARNDVSCGLYYAYRGDTWWASEPVDSAGTTVWGMASLALDDSNYPHISYYDNTSHTLKYAMDICPLTTSTVSPSPSPSVYGQPVTFTAIVSWQQPCAPAPTGTVTFMDVAATLGTRTLDASAQATLTTSSLSAGGHTISAPYGGDSNYYASAVVPTLHIVNTANTTTTLISDTNPSVFGQSVTFTATVSVVAPGAGTPTGNVTFMDGATTLGTGILASGQATFSTSNLSVGDHNITAEYGGNGNFNASTSSPLSQTVNKANTTTTLDSDSNPSVYGEPVTFTVTVSAVPPGAGTPTGNVTFMDGAAMLGTRTLDASGQATLSTSGLSVGIHTITAEYGGDDNFNFPPLNPLAQTVNKANTTTTLLSSQNPSIFGQLVTFTVTISAVPPGAGTPTGNVTFMGGTTMLGIRTLDASGQATLSTSSLSVGTHTITAEYGGDDNFNFPPLNPLAQTVNKADTSTALISDLNPSIYGESVTFTATVSAVAPGTGIPTGTVAFKEGTTILGTGTLAAGQATFSTADLAAGVHNITAEYEGDASFNSSSSDPLAQTVNKADTTTALVSDLNPSIYGESITFTATVSAVAPGAGTPTGTVTFKDGATTMGNGTLASGQATFSTSSLSVGDHNITAEYGGDGNFNASTSGPLTQTVNKADSDTTLSSSQNPSVFGQPVTFTATVAAVAPGAGTPTGTVTFKDGATTLSTGTLASGQATISTSSLSAGDHNITAEYGGDGSFNSSTSSPLTQTVSSTGGSSSSAGRSAPIPPRPQAPPRILLLTVNVQPQQTTSNQPVTISASVFNQGYAACSYSFDLKVNGQVEQTRSGNIDGQGAALLEFQVAKSEPGTYTVDIGGHRSFFTIVEQAIPEEKSNTPSSMSTATVVLIIAGSLVAAFLLYLLVIYICRRRYYR